jgi:NodT family efflux transporter outer membrane factor (OMF) lipoprotein
MLASCAPDVGSRLAISTPARYQSAKSFTAPAVAWPADSWWRAFGDPQLDALIDEALKGSPDLALAAARLHRADAMVTEVRGVSTPGVTVQGSAGVEHETINTGVDPALQPFLPRGWKSEAKVGLGIDYALDFFGRNRAALAAATSEAEAVRGEQAAARIAIAAAVAEAYGTLLRDDAQRASAADALRIRGEGSGLVAQRRREGLENQGRSAQAAAAEQSARVDLALFERAIILDRNRIAALLGAGPDRGLAITLPGQVRALPFGLPADVGIDLIGRRPDIVAARLRVDAAAQRIKVERAAFYPDIRLTALVGLQSIPLDRLIESGSIAGHAGPAISLPLFKSSGALRGAAARYDEAVALYDGALVQALREVADALADEQALGDALAKAQSAAASSEAAYRVARLRYTGGLSNYLDVLTSETDLVMQRRRVAAFQAQRMLADIALARALGGGFVAGGQQDRSGA